ncbi:DNA repair protein RAD59 [Spathaspora sp. JA1]|nr:DNA repair protein RAD59 [Spathaspora sp. JA1]
MNEFDLKYELSASDAAELANVPSTLQLFPDVSLFEEEDEDTNELDTNEYIDDWTLQKIGTLQSRLESLENKRYFGKYESRSVAARTIYDLANDVFGFNGWSTTILDCIFADVTEEAENYSAKCTVKIRLTLRSGTTSEHYGFAEATNLPHKYMCYNKCKKHAVTDATKNAILGLKEFFYRYEKRKLEEQVENYVLA